MTNSIVNLNILAYVRNTNLIHVCAFWPAFSGQFPLHCGEVHPVVNKHTCPKCYQGGESGFSTDKNLLPPNVENIGVDRNIQSKKYKKISVEILTSIKIQKKWQKFIEKYEMF